MSDNKKITEEKILDDFPFDAFTDLIELHIRPNRNKVYVLLRQYLQVHHNIDVNMDCEDVDNMEYRIIRTLEEAGYSLADDDIDEDEAAQAAADAAEINKLLSEP